MNADLSVSVGDGLLYHFSCDEDEHTAGLWSHTGVPGDVKQVGRGYLIASFLPSETLLCFKALLSRYHTLRRKRIALCGERKRGSGEEGGGVGEASLRIKPGSGVGLDFLRTTPFNDQL